MAEQVAAVEKSEFHCIAVYKIATDNIASRDAVTVSLSPIGSAPVLSQKKFMVSRDRSMGWLNQWLRKNLKCDSAESVVSVT